jgi:hypothetical protein
VKVLTEISFLLTVMSEWRLIVRMPNLCTSAVG